MEDAEPIIEASSVVLGTAAECVVHALDLKSGKLLWKTLVPDCSYYRTKESDEGAADVKISAVR